MPTPLKRTIGYVKPRATTKTTEMKTPSPVPRKPTVKEFEEAKKAVKDTRKKDPHLLEKEIIKVPYNTESSTARQLIAWIKKHPLFKWAVMCQQIGIDKSNFKRAMLSKEPVIKPEIAAKIEAVLKEYGYGK